MGSHCRSAQTYLVNRNWPVAWGDTLPYGQGFRVRTEQGMGYV